MRRKPGAFVPLELAILEAAAASGQPLHGFELAKALATGERSRALTAHGTLYKALGRLTVQGLLESEWEDPELAVRAGRPRRRLYRLTGEGARRLTAEARVAEPSRPAAGLA